MIRLLLLAVLVVGQEYAQVSKPGGPTDVFIVSVYLTQPPAKPVTPSPDLSPLVTTMDWSITIRYIDNTGSVLVDNHAGADAGPLVKAILNGNFTQTSLNKHLLQHLITEKKIPPATVVGKAVK
jgi:hypothetical protein